MRCVSVILPSRLSQLPNRTGRASAAAEFGTALDWRVTVECSKPAERRAYGRADPEPSHAGDQGRRAARHGRRAGQGRDGGAGGQRPRRRPGRGRRHRVGADRPAAADRRPDRRDGRRSARPGRAARPGRRRGPRLDQRQRRPGPAGPGAVRGGRHHLRGAAQRDRRRGRHLPEVRQRGAAPRLVLGRRLERGDRRGAAGRSGRCRPAGRGDPTGARARARSPRS